MNGEQARELNVWSGDVVRFAAPLGNLRRASWSAYGWVIAALVVSCLMMMVVPGGHGIAIAVVVSMIWLVVLLGNDILGTANRWVARRQLARYKCETLSDLAAICWLRSLVGRRSNSRFDAAEWIRRTGPDGPRVICRDFGLAAVRPDGSATEEEPVMPWLEESRDRRARLWAGVVVFGGISAWFVYEAIVSRRYATVGTAGISLFFVITFLRQLGVIGRTLAPISISPEGLRVLGQTGTITFTREDSVLMIEPSGRSSRVLLHWVRADGESVDVQTSTEHQAKTLPMVLTRWCWRGGAGATVTGYRLRSEEAAPEDVRPAERRD